MKNLSDRLTIGLALCVLAACKSGNGATAAPGGGGRAQMGPVPVEVTEARSDTVIDAILATGQIEAVSSVELRPDIDGRLVEILVREGSLVATGAPLFKVDDAELKAQVSRGEAERDLARQALDRTRGLLAEKAAAPADLERAEAQMRSTQAALELLQVRLDRTTVRAPFGGVAGARLVSVGDYVTTATKLITLQTVNPQRASFQIPERYSDRLRVGQRVLFQVAALPGRNFSGTVDFVDPQVQLPGRTITVKAVVPNSDRALQAGMFIEARLATEIRQHAIVVPEDAITQIQGGAFLWTVVDGKASRKRVELGVRTPGYVEIRNGVALGDQVVVGGIDRLVENAPVNATVVNRTPERSDSLERK
ncbi:MAG TPA: efflux RND transporter periplasmic adaptor subunit [Gemmatimonadales bacterium]|nr:efflux RND transporter periplasmic adaptor subunit [Gemmatimonadales bacterium]